MSKIKSFFANKKFIGIFILTLITLLGLYLRMIQLDKPNGMWSDEMFSYYAAKKLFTQDWSSFIWQSPLIVYTAILKLWMGIFGEADFTLRFLSVLFGVLNIPLLYLTGKELNSKKVGLTAALLGSINSFMIYYSQEVRYYSLLTLLGTLSVLFLLKVMKNPKKWNYIGLVLSNLLILFCFPVGFVFVALEYLIFSIYLYFEDRQNLKKFFIAQIVNLLLYFPSIGVLIYNIFFLKGQVVNIPVYFSITNILLILQNWFTPVVEGTINIPPMYYETISKNSIPFTLFILIPVIISLVSLIHSCVKNKLNLFLLTLLALFVGAEIAGTLTGNFVLICKYTILVLPIAIILVSEGLCRLQNRFVYRTVLSLLFIINVYFILAQPENISAPKMNRFETFKEIADILEEHDFNKKDYCLFPFVYYYWVEKGDFVLSKYYDKTKYLDIRDENIFINISNELISMKTIFENDKYKSLRKDPYLLYKQYLSSTEVSKPFENHILKNSINKIPKGRFLIVIVSKRGLALFDKPQLLQNVRDDIVYHRIPITFMLQSKLANDVLDISFKYLKPINLSQKGVWDVYIFEKK